MSRKKLKDPFDFLEEDPYKSLLYILHYAPGYNKRLQAGLKTKELRYLLVRGYSADLGLYKEGILKGFRIYIEKKLKDKIQLDQEIAKSRQAFNNILKRAIRNGLIEKSEKNKWILSDKFLNVLIKNEIVLQIGYSDKNLILNSFNDITEDINDDITEDINDDITEDIGYALFFISQHMKNTIEDKYTGIKFYNAISKILKGRMELEEIIVSESRAICVLFRVAVLKSITPHMDQQLADFFTNYNIIHLNEQYPNDSFITKKYSDIILDHFSNLTKKYLRYDKKSQEYKVKKLDLETAANFRDRFYPSKNAKEIVTMLNGHQINKKASAFIKQWPFFCINAIAINNQITMVIPPPYFFVDVYQYLSLDNKKDTDIDLFNDLKYIQEEKELNETFDNYMRLLRFNTLPKDLQKRLNILRAAYHSEIF